jgi:hypothetical protein
MRHACPPFCPQQPPAAHRPTAQAASPIPGGLPRAQEVRTRQAVMARPANHRTTPTLCASCGLSAAAPVAVRHVYGREGLGPQPLPPVTLCCTPGARNLLAKNLPVSLPTAAVMLALARQGDAARWCWALWWYRCTRRRIHRRCAPVPSRCDCCNVPGSSQCPHPPLLVHRYSVAPGMVARSGPARTRSTKRCEHGAHDISIHAMPHDFMSHEPLPVWGWQPWHAAHAAHRARGPPPHWAWRRSGTTHACLALCA